MVSPHKSSILMLIILLLTSSIAIAFAFAQSTPMWAVQTVDEKGQGQRLGSSGYCPIAVDSNDTPHILYTGNDYPPSEIDILRYASWNGSGWTTQEIPYATGYSLVLDATGNPHILYSEYGLKYAVWTGSDWATKTIDSSFVNGIATLALDSKGNPQVAYTDGTTVKYANLTGLSWNIQTIDTFPPEIDPFLSLTLNHNNEPTIMYGVFGDYFNNAGVNIGSETLRLATFSNSSWNIQNAVLTPPIGGYSNMVLDSKGNNHFVFMTTSLLNFDVNNTLVYASWDGSTWSTQTLATNISLGADSHANIGSLVLDSHDYPHFVYNRGQGTTYA